MLDGGDETVMVIVFKLQYIRTILHVKQPTYRRADTIISLGLPRLLLGRARGGTSHPWMGSANAPVISKEDKMRFPRCMLEMDFLKAIGYLSSFSLSFLFLITFLRSYLRLPSTSS